MAFKNGYLYHLSPCNIAVPAKPKFVLCVSKELIRFYLINSCDALRPYEYEKDFAVIFQGFRLKCLNHDSYININRLEAIPGPMLQNVAIEEKEPLPNDYWNDVRNKVRDFDIDRPRCRISQETKDIVGKSIKDK